jgi:hypothetical protein
MKTDQWWLSLHLLELITFDPNIRFEKTRPRRKGKEMKNTWKWFQWMKYQLSGPKN